MDYLPVVQGGRDILNNTMNAAEPVDGSWITIQLYRGAGYTKQNNECCSRTS